MNQETGYKKNAVDSSGITVKKNVRNHRHISYLFTNLIFAFSPAPVAPHVFRKLTRLVQTLVAPSSTFLHTPLCLFRLRDTYAGFRVRSLHPRPILLCIPSSVIHDGGSLSHTRRKPRSALSMCQILSVYRICPVHPCRCSRLRFSRLSSFSFSLHYIILLQKHFNFIYI